MKLKKYYHIEENAFSVDECNKIIEFAESGEFLVEDRQFEFRDSDVVFFPPTEQSEWLYDKLYTMLNDVKKKTWRTFKIHTLQPLQYTVYKAPGGRYNWHCDTGPHHSGMEQRILSLVVQLFDPNTYEGGEFEIAEHAEYDLSKAMWGQAPNRDTVRSISAPQGSVTVFPSFIQHRVLPVTKGTRKSLVGWCDGKFI